MNPCQKVTWADLQGHGRERHCDSCGRSVHAIEQYSEEEWSQIWNNSTGRVCGMLCQESWLEPRSRRAMLVGAFLTALSPLMAQSASVRVRVVDPLKLMMPEAEVSLLGPDKEPIRTEETTNGEVVLMGLPVGNNRLRIKSPGWQTRFLTVTLRNRREVKVEVGLQIPVIGETVEVKEKPRKRNGWLLY